jgi:hypothetical protein
MQGNSKYNCVTVVWLITEAVTATYKNVNKLTISEKDVEFFYWLGGRFLKKLVCTVEGLPAPKQDKTLFYKKEEG